MQKYSELSLDQKKLVDTHVALTIVGVMGSSEPPPSFIAQENYIEELRKKFSFRITAIEKTRYGTFLKAKEAGIDTTNPQAFINHAVKTVQKLNPGLPDRMQQNKKLVPGVRTENPAAT